MERSVFRQISYGMYIVAAMDNGRPTGCVVNTVSQVTSENPKISISLNHDNYTYDVIKREGKFSISIISEDTDPEIIKVFGFKSGRDTDKFASFEYEVLDGLPVFTKDFCGSLICEVLEMVNCGTHDIITAKVLNSYPGDAKAPMTYAYYHSVIKGRAPKNAPTYQEEDVAEDSGERYVCALCGYVCEGDITKEPDDYTCPVCGAPKECFEKQ